MRHEAQVKPGDVRPLRADPECNNGAAASLETDSSANTRVIGPVFFFNSRANSNSANTPEL